MLMNLFLLTYNFKIFVLLKEMFICGLVFILKYLHKTRVNSYSPSYLDWLVRSCMKEKRGEKQIKT